MGVEVIVGVGVMVVVSVGVRVMVGVPVNVGVPVIVGVEVMVGVSVGAPGLDGDVLLLPHPAIKAIGRETITIKLTKRFFTFLFPKIFI